MPTVRAPLRPRHARGGPRAPSSTGARERGGVRPTRVASPVASCWRVGTASSPSSSSAIATATCSSSARRRRSASRAARCSTRSTWATSSAPPGHVVRTRRGELSLKVDDATMLTKALRPLPEKWHGLQDPDLQQRRRYLHLIDRPGAAAVRRGARHRLAHDPSRAGRSRIHRGRDAHPATGRRRRAGQAVHDPPQRAGHRPQAPHLARALPEAIAGRRPRADLRDGSQLPQRGHRPGTQPGVHDAGAVRGLRRLRDDDADRRGPDPRVRAGVARLPRAPVPGWFARPGAAVPPGHGARVRCPRRRGHRSSSSAIS